MWTHENISKKIKYWFPFLQILINETGCLKFAIQYVNNQDNIKKWNKYGAQRYGIRHTKRLTLDVHLIVISIRRR